MATGKRKLRSHVALPSRNRLSICLCAPCANKSGAGRCPTWWLYAILYDLAPYDAANTKFRDVVLGRMHIELLQYKIGKEREKEKK